MKRPHKHRPWRVLAAALTTGLALSACGGGGGAGGTAASGGDKTLRVWFPGNLSNEVTWVNGTLVPAFEKQHPGVDVQVEFVDWANLSTRLSTAFAGNTAPDVFGHGNAAAAGFADAGRIQPLDEQVAALPEADRTDLTFLNDGKVGGKQYIMPLRGFGYLVAYRKDLVKEAGLDFATPPATWEDLRAAAGKLAQREGGKVTRSGLLMPADNTISMSQAFGTLLFQAGGKFLAGDGKTVTWNAPEGVAALEHLTGLYQGSDAVSSGLGEKTASTGAQHPLATGRAAMALVDDATLKTIHEQSPELAEKIGVLSPVKKAEAVSFGGAGNGMFISAKTKLKKEAWDFISFMLKPENVKAYSLTVGGIPARTSVAKDPELTKVSYLAPFMEAAPQFRGNPNVATWTQLRDALGKEIEKALRGTTPPRKALDDAAAAAEELLKG
ncbi:ABC transporter substrate-binding protein [Sinosporangium siamense]|uniref:ABC transporter substrate-binding protein n=1 Tax=Sinosporangium siamense TaxID=1367973 RepID=A0A919RFQ4_9ACTN|nr:ABC transporter substrate-binding protein [Sinosporangium siamense]GII91574.1 ABC transporter substrate-binding protein [Sinosporangium siamense]